MAKLLNERKTISNSKRAFHKTFPHVIPALYRRVADELLVELHLLAHQKHFKPETLFAIGLTTVFDEFTKGYEPESHRKSLFIALCKCNGLDAEALRKQADTSIESFQTFNIDNFVKSKDELQTNSIGSAFTQLGPINIEYTYYSRMLAIGLIRLLKEVDRDLKYTEESLLEVTSIIADKIGLSKARVTKDIAMYKANKDKLLQAQEIINESIKNDKKKRVEKAKNQANVK